MNERRKNDRIDAYDVGLAVFNGIDDEQLGIIGNLSQGGMMLITTRQLYSDGILQLKIKAPMELGGETVRDGRQDTLVHAGQQPGRILGGPGDHRYQRYRQQFTAKPAGQAAQLARTRHRHHGCWWISQPLRRRTGAKVVAIATI